MDRTNFGATSEIISRITDPNQLQAMLKNPQYAGFTAVIIARLTDINRMRQSQQGAVPPAPTVAQQTITGQAPPQQAMARGGIVAFKSGGKVKKLEEYKYKQDEYTPDTPAEVPVDIKAPTPEQGSSMKQFLDQMGQDSAPAPAGGIRGFADGGAVPAAPEGLDLQPHSKRWLHALHDTLYPSYATPIGPDDVDSPPAAAPAPVTYGGPDADRSGNIAAASSGANPASALDPNFFSRLSGLDGSDYSLGVSSGGRGGGYYPATPAVRSTSDYINEYKNSMGPNTDLSEARARLADMTKSRAAQAGNSLNMAMIRAGLGMASDASTNPRSGILGNLASGATAGLGQYTSERDQMNKDRAEELQRQVQLGQISRQEAADQYRYGAGEHRSDVQAARAMEVAKMQEAAASARDALRLGAMNKPAQVMDRNARAFAQDAYQRDIAAGRPPRTMGEYYQEGMGYANPATGIASMRSSSAEQVMLSKIYNDAEKNNPGSGARAVQMYQMQVQGSGSGGAGGKDYGTL